MDGGLIIYVVIDALHYINFSSIWPIGSCGYYLNKWATIVQGHFVPLLQNALDQSIGLRSSKGGLNHLRPNTATSGHMYGIQNNQPAIVTLFRGNPYAFPVSLNSRRSFYTHYRISLRVDIDKAIGFLCEVRKGAWH
jgi:hypothetical protein